MSMVKCVSRMTNRFEKARTEGPILAGMILSVPLALESAVVATAVRTFGIRGLATYEAQAASIVIAEEVAGVAAGIQVSRKIKQRVIEDVSSPSTRFTSSGKPISVDDLDADFVTKGINIDPLSIPEGQRLVARLQRASPDTPREDIIVRARQQLSTGKDIPKLSQVQEGEKLFKVVPKGKKPSDFTPYFTDQAGRDRLVTGKSNIADVTAVPNQSAAQELDIFSITPKKFEKPTVFKSEIAPIQQGSIKRKGGEQQTIVPERSLFEDPVFEETIKERF